MKKRYKNDFGRTLTMNSLFLRVAVGAALVGVGSAAPARAGLTGSTYDFATSGSAIVANLSSGGNPYTVGGSSPGFCVGPGFFNGFGCASGQMMGFVVITDNQVSLNFSGNLPSLLTDTSFTVALTNFSVPITNVAYNSGSLEEGTLALTSWDGSSITFTANSSATNSYAGLGSIVFDVATDVPEPASMMLLGASLAALGVIRHRKAV
jgi:hypothetical protein